MDRIADYRNAPSGIGPLAHTWGDKPHRLLYDLATEVERLQVLLRDVVVAAGRMRDDWAEADDAVKKRLWSNLHTAADAAEDDVYPLAPEVQLIDGCQPQENG